MGLTVLIIDESASTTDFFGGTLRAQGMDVTFCHSGAEGLELARSISFDFILLELFSPGSDGWESCKKLRAQTTAPIVVLSALNHPLLGLCSWFVTHCSLLIVHCSLLRYNSARRGAASRLF